MDAITPLVKERPIIFSAPMVCAILEGRKTQTRRVVKPPRWSVPEEIYEFAGDVLVPDDDGADYFIKCPYGQPGDRLWVRESFSEREYDGGKIEEWALFHYWADGNPSFGDWPRPKPSIHMPRWASRITLEIVSVRVERLQDISEADCVRESDTTKTEINKTDKPIPPTPKGEPDGFEEIWRGRGSAQHVRLRAVKAYVAALKRGAKHVDIFAAVKACAGIDKPGTVFAPMLSSWLNEDRWKADETGGMTPGEIAAAEERLAETRRKHDEDMRRRVEAKSAQLRGAA